MGNLGAVSTVLEKDAFGVVNRVRILNLTFLGAILSLAVLGVFFSDVRGFTAMSESMFSPRKPKCRPWTHPIQRMKRTPEQLVNIRGACWRGYALSLVPRDSREYFNDGFLAFNPGFSADFRNAAIRRSPALRGLGWEVILSRSSSTATYRAVRLDVLQIHLTFGLRYLTPFNFPLNFLIRAAGGIGFSLHSSANARHDTDIGGFTIENKVRQTP